jgi:hypothetical protein
MPEPGPSHAICLNAHRACARRAGCGVINNDHSHFDELTSFRMADDELFPGIAGKNFFMVVTILVLDQKIVIPQQSVNLLWVKLPHLE